MLPIVEFQKRCRLSVTSMCSILIILINDNERNGALLKGRYKITLIG